MLRCIILFALCAAPLFGQTSSEIRAGFEDLANAHPGHVRLHALAEGRPNLYAVILRDAAITGPLPAVLILGTLRGDEITPGTACYRIARELLKGNASRALLKRCEIIFIPTPNPDARDLRFAEVPDAVAGTLLPFDADRDGQADEDGPSDINGDGRITQMRVKRPGGRYVISKHDPRILLEAAPGVQGEYDLYWEGVDDDGDGRINEDPRGTVTLSNDWSIRWSDKQAGANHFMMQLAETRALAEFIVERRSIVAAFQLRNFGGLEFAGGPPAGRGDDEFKRDKDMQAMIRKLWPVGDDSEAAKLIPQPPEGAGNVLDWLYESQGVHAANIGLIEMREPDFDTPPPKGEASADFMREVWWLTERPDQHDAWRAFKHPQLGDVEIGGWDITARRDPRGEDAVPGVERVTTFLKALAGTMPRVEVSKVEVEAKGAGLYRVRATLHNAGGLDYRTAFSERHNIHLPMFVSLADEIELISGTRRQRHENLPVGGTATLEWLVRVKDDEAELKFQIESERTGNATHTVKVAECPAIQEEERD